VENEGEGTAPSSKQRVGANERALNWGGLRQRQRRSAASRRRGVGNWVNWAGVKGGRRYFVVKWGWVVSQGNRLDKAESFEAVESKRGERCICGGLDIGQRCSAPVKPAQQAHAGDAPSKVFIEVGFATLGGS
jgi:hypothetical protein